MKRSYPISYLLLATLLVPILSYAEAPPADTPEKQTELRTVAPHRVVNPATFQSLPPSPERNALLAIQEEGRLRVQALADRIRVLPDGTERREMMQRVRALKREYRIRFLQAKISFARARGNFSTAERIETVIERFLNPRMSVAAPAAKKPVKALPETGGQP